MNKKQEGIEWISLKIINLNIFYLIYIKYHLLLISYFNNLNNLENKKFDKYHIISFHENHSCLRA